jgi:hypothetical protein
MNNRIDSIIFDLKETLDHLANELKLMQQKYKELDRRVRAINVKKV